MSTGRVDEAFRACPREWFLPESVRHRAAFDGPLQIGCGQTSSQPRTVADMLRLLDVAPGDRVLDVGAGSGWTTALLAHLTGETGRVDGVEIEPEVAALGRSQLAAAGMPWASLETADPEVLGLPEQAPYERILVSAEAGTLPQTLVAQLAAGGVLVIPVGGRMLRVVAGSPGEEPSVTRHGHYRFVPLR